MIKIGITGSLASGKTSASKILSHKRGPVFNADKEGYADEILSLLSQPYEKIISQWIEMRPFRLSMIKKYVSLYNDSPGGRISHRLLNDYF